MDKKGDMSIFLEILLWIILAGICIYGIYRLVTYFMG